MGLIRGSFEKVRRRFCCVDEKLRFERARKNLGSRKDRMRDLSTEILLTPAYKASAWIPLRFGVDKRQLDFFHLAFDWKPQVSFRRSSCNVNTGRFVQDIKSRITSRIQTIIKFFDEISHAPLNDM